MTDIEKLRALYGAATPGSWAADHDGGHSAEETHDYAHLATDGIGHNSLFGTENADVRESHHEDDGEGGVRYFDPIGRANIELVVAMHEALPAMLAELEAGRALFAHMCEGEGTDPEKGGQLLDDYQRARDGLVADGQFAEVG